MSCLWPPGPSTPILRASSVHLWCVNLDQMASEYAQNYAVLDKGEKLRAAALRTEQLRRRFVNAHYFLRQTLSRYLGCAPGEIFFDLESRGKPVLSASHGLRVHFNLSHSGPWALCAVVGKECQVGCDIEETRSNVEAQDIARRFFHPQESVYIDQQADPERAFYSLWTAKEAYVKALGVGISSGLDNFCLKRNTQKRGDTTWDLQAIDNPQAFWSIENIWLNEGLCAAFAADTLSPLLEEWQFA